MRTHELIEPTRRANNRVSDLPVYVRFTDRDQEIDYEINRVSREGASLIIHVSRFDEADGSGVTEGDFV